MADFTLVVQFKHVMNHWQSHIVFFTPGLVELGTMIWRSHQESGEVAW